MDGYIVVGPHSGHDFTPYLFRGNPKGNKGLTLLPFVYKLDLFLQSLPLNCREEGI